MRGLDCRWGQGSGRMHLKHVAHVRYAGGVPAQGLVKGDRVLPRAQAGQTVRGELRAGRREAAADRVQEGA